MDTRGGCSWRTFRGGARGGKPLCPQVHFTYSKNVPNFFEFHFIEMYDKTNVGSVVLWVVA